MKVIFMEQAGPLISYEFKDDGPVLTIEDLNPQHTITWRMTRWELVKVGLRCIGAALWEQAPLKPTELGH